MAIRALDGAKKKLKGREDGREEKAERLASSIHNEFDILETDVQTFEPFCPLLAFLFESHSVSLYLTKQYL